MIGGNSIVSHLFDMRMSTISWFVFIFIFYVCFYACFVSDACLVLLLFVGLNWIILLLSGLGFRFICGG